MYVVIVRVGKRETERYHCPFGDSLEQKNRKQKIYVGYPSDSEAKGLH